jgi:hypothetical protein
LKKEREKTLAIFVGACMVLTLCMVGLTVTADASDYVYVDAPTGNPLLDYAAIQGALDAMSPGDTIVLAPGVYTIYKTLVKVGFHGAIIGAGIDETMIKAVNGPSGEFLASHNPVFDDTSGEGSEDYETAFFLFGSPEKKLEVSDLTLYIDELTYVERCYTTFPVDPTYYWPNPGYKMWSAIEVTLAQGCDTSFDSVRVTGVPGLGWAGSPRNGISIWYSSGGKHTLSNSILENIGTFAYGPYQCDSAKVVVESNQFIDCQRGIQSFYSYGMNIGISGNTFAGLAWPGIYNMYLEGSHMTVSRNHFEACRGGIWTYTIPGYPQVGSNFIFSHNNIDVQDGADFAGIEVWDTSEAKSHFVINHNNIHQESFLAPYSGICTNGVHDAVIANNVITGSGPAAMFIGTWLEGVYDVGVKIINNDVQGFLLTAGLWHDYETGNVVDTDPFGHYYLGPYSRYCILVLGSSIDTYLNQGMYNLVVERG